MGEAPSKFGVAILDQLGPKKKLIGLLIIEARDEPEEMERAIQLAYLEARQRDEIPRLEKLYTEVMPLAWGDSEDQVLPVGKIFTADEAKELMEVLARVEQAPLN